MSTKSTKPISTIKLDSRGREVTVDVKVHPDYGVPLVFLEPAYRRGKIVKLYLSMMQTKDHGTVYEVDCPNSEGIIVEQEITAASLLRLGWCRDHKASYMAVPLKPDVTRLHVLLCSSSIVVFGYCRVSRAGEVQQAKPQHRFH